MKTIIHQDCCDECKKLIEGINKKNGTNKVISLTMETSEKVQLRHLKVKKNAIQDTLEKARNKYDESPIEKSSNYHKSKASSPKQSNDLLKVAEEHTVGMIAMTMKHNPDTLAIQIRGCRSMWGLCYNEYQSNGSRSTSEVISAILEAMEKHHDKPELAEMAFEALSALSYKDISNVRLIINQGGVHVVANTIKLHSSNHLMREKGISCLCSLIYYYSETMNCMSAVENIILELVKSMKEYHDIQSIQVKALWAILHLSGNHHDTKLVNAISSAGVIPLLLLNMGTHEMNSEIQEFCCGIIANLSVKHYTNRSVLLKKNAAAKIVYAIETHLDNRKVVLAGCEALLNMTTTDDASILQNTVDIDNKIIDAIIKENAFGLLVDIMKKHSHDSKIQEIACRLLRSLSFTLHTMKCMSDSVPLTLLLSAKKKFPFECSDHVSRLLRRSKFMNVC